jgi:hypothetical protein
MSLVDIIHKLQLNWLLPTVLHDCSGYTIADILESNELDEIEKQ